MRLFLVERISLHTLAEGPGAPVKGDVVAFFRHAQDIDGSAAARLRDRGVHVEWAEDRLDLTDEEVIDAFIETFSQVWYQTGGVDQTRADGISLGGMITGEIISRYRINYLVRYGEIHSRLFDAFPETREVVSDIVDAVTPFCDDRPDSLSIPHRRLLRDMTGARGIRWCPLAVSDPIPSAVTHHRGPLRPWMILRTFAGGFRPAFLLARLRLALTRRQKHRARVYIFFCPGLISVGSALGRRSDVEVLGDRTHLSAVTPLRYDHLLALPNLGVLRAARRLRKTVGRIRRHGFAGNIANHNGTDYAPYFLSIITHAVGLRLAIGLIKIGQSKAMLRRYRPDLVVINGETHPATLGIIHYAPLYGCRVAFIEHSPYMVPFGYYPHGRNNPSVIYVTPGEDYVETYGKHLPEDQKPWRPVVATPSTMVMNDVRGRRADPPGRRVLITNYGATIPFSVNRGKYYDRYMIDILKASRALVDRGYHVSYRPHPGYKNPAYVTYMLKSCGMTDKITVDTVPEFPDSLAEFDILVTNSSGCFYQALYAGWPTIFYEPEFKPQQFVGLAAATDIDRPIATTPEELAQMIRDGVENPDSLTARFPEIFNSVYAERFIGRNADQADQIIADFLIDHCLATGDAARASTFSGAESRLYQKQV